MPYPCSGPIASSVLSTMRSSVPCRTSDLVSVISCSFARASRVGDPHERSRAPVGCQHECFRGSVMIDSSGAMTGFHDDEVLGKAYDARLMRRLLAYLRPYWRQVAVAFLAIVAGAAAQLAQPYLIKTAIDRHIATGRLAGLDRLAVIYLLIL